MSGSQGRQIPQHDSDKRLGLGAMLRQYRLERGLSQESLAARSGVSPRAISDLERGQRRGAHPETLQRLAHALDLHGHERTEFFTAQEKYAKRGSSTTNAQAVPEPGQPDSLIGREHEIAALLELVRGSDSRLITLTGPGGVGKTRLAQEVAARLSDRDIVFLQLASITEPIFVFQAIGQAFGLSGSDHQSLPPRISMVLQEKETVLILDNFEQILPAAPVVSEILGATPSLTVLATSRVPLRVVGETIVPVEPLPLPASASESSIRESPAVQLMLERAALSGDRCSQDELQHVAAICRKLDGLPLAIELAAATMRIVSPSELIGRLDRPLVLLQDGRRDVPERLQSMRNAIRWSYDLLTDDQRAIFRRLAVFRNGFTVSSAEKLLPQGDSATVALLLRQLFDANLIHRMSTPSPTPRFTMFEAVREFGMELLEEYGEADETRDRHLALFVELLGAPDPGNWFVERKPWHIPLPEDHDNLRLALNWAVTRRDVFRGLQIASGLFFFWRSNSFFEEASEALGLVASLDLSLLSQRQQVVLMQWRNGFSYLSGEFEDVQARALNSVKISRDHGFHPELLESLATLAMVSRWSDRTAALKLHDERLQLNSAPELWEDRALTFHQRSFTHMVWGDFASSAADLESMQVLLASADETDTALAAYAFGGSGWIAGVRGDVERAEKFADQCLAIAQRVGIAELHQWSLRTLGEVWMARNDLPKAEEHYLEALRLVYKRSLKLWEGFIFAQVAKVAELWNDLPRAGLLYGAAEANWGQLGVVPGARAGSVSWFHDGSPHPDSLKHPRFASSLAEGRKRSRVDAFATALGND